MKKLKLSLDELKLESFITELKPEAAEIAKGGTTPSSVPCYEGLTLIVSVIESIHDTGDQNSWWHCTPDSYTCGVETATSCPPAGGDPYNASDFNTQYGCLLPPVYICG